MLIHGDCLEELKRLNPNSIDSMVTDPPAGISFMGKEWDHHKGGRDEWIKWMESIMRECLRVMKPGAHGLVWAIPRTSHWTATALENAGFEVRDVVTHLFGSGFPKSLDISKAIDKAAGATREIISTIKKTPSAAKCHEGWERPWAEGKTTMDITTPSTDSAKQWQGWGTALKPASEHWILIRKPCGEKTVAANVLKHGTGGINIDASRVEAADQAVLDAAVKRMTGNTAKTWTCGNPTIEPKSAQGRFPANLVLTEGEATEMLDAQSGLTKSTPHSLGKGIGDKTFKTNNEQINFGAQNDSGGASRFFYCAKISSSERGEGNTHPTVKPKKLMSYLIRMITPTGGVVLDPFMGSGSTGIAAKECGFDFIGIEKEKEYFEISTGRIGSILV